MSGHYLNGGVPKPGDMVRVVTQWTDDVGCHLSGERGVVEKWDGRKAVVALDPPRGHDHSDPWPGQWLVTQPHHLALIPPPITVPVVMEPADARWLTEFDLDDILKTVPPTLERVVRLTISAVRGLPPSTPPKH
jgi:hypothetical protein